MITVNGTVNKNCVTGENCQYQATMFFNNLFPEYKLTENYHNMKLHNYKSNGGKNKQETVFGFSKK